MPALPPTAATTTGIATAEAKNRATAQACRAVQLSMFATARNRKDDARKRRDTHADHVDRIRAFGEV